MFHWFQPMWDSTDSTLEMYNAAMLANLNRTDKDGR